jgi:PAS domain S-box-containing protein
MTSSPYQADDIDLQIAPNPIEARMQLAAIVESSDDAIISKDLSGIITSWNAAATRLFGYQPNEIIGKSVLTLIPPDLHSEEPEILRKVSAGQRLEHYETTRRRKDGALLQISLTISPIRDPSGKIVGISKIARDITEKKQAEAALFESERLAAIGRMAASIAHEVNNPLEAILNLGYLIAADETLNPTTRDYAKMLVTEVIRVGEITKQTLSFYREAAESSRINIEELLASVLRLNQPMLQRKSIRVVTRFRKPPFLFARPGELRQVFTNLILNATDALPEGGCITASTSHIHDGQVLCINIADNGPGIPPQIREKVFEPFFSTKTSKGTGLGLWVSQSIVRKNGGTIQLRSSSAPATRTGTIFRICMPVQQ